MPALRRLLLALLPVAMAALVLIPGTAASAHTALVSSTPAANSTLHKVPTSVSLTFTEDLTPEVTQIRVVDGEGLSMAAGDPVTQGETVTQDLRATLHPGPYVVTYKVISADGHPVSGAIPFTIAADAVASTATSVSGPGDSTPTSVSGPGDPTPATPSAATSTVPPSADTRSAATPTGAATPESDTSGGASKVLLGGLVLLAIALGVMIGRRYRARQH